MKKKELINEIIDLRKHIERTITDYKATESDKGWNECGRFVLSEIDFILEEIGVGKQNETDI